MKTLVVKYTPREGSYTKQLLDAFLEKSTNADIDVIDIAKDVPDLFLAENLKAYIMRNYMGKELSDDLRKSISKMDRMTKQFKDADVVVMAFPMYNFSMPAAVKAYFDSILMKGETWDMGEGGYIGLMNGKKALILMSSGGMYEGQMASWDHATTLAKLEFQFMGFEKIEQVTIGGVNADPASIEKKLLEAKEKIRSIASDWYS